jgi:DNA-binding CsgD family transcriptional regulator
MAFVDERLAAPGRAGPVIVDGPPGSGKTSLVRAATRAAQEAGYRTASFGPVDGPQAPLSLSQDPGPSSPSVLPGFAGPCPWLFDQVFSQLEALATSSPLLVAVDDLQWADRTVWATVERLVPRARDLPVLWLLAGRDGSVPLQRFFLRLEDEARAKRVRLGSLAPAAVSELLAADVGDDRLPGALMLSRCTGGNPLLVRELAAAIRGPSPDQLPGALNDGMAAPERARAKILGWRLGYLSAQARHLAQVASVLGRRFTIEHLAGTMSQPDAAVVGPLEEALRAGLLVAIGPDLAFGANSVGEFVYETVPEPVRSALHRKAGLLMLARGDAARAAAAHLVLTARPNQRDVLAGLDQAAKELLATVPYGAADIALRAMELTQPGPERASRAANAVDALLAAGRLSEATSVATEALGSAKLPPAQGAHLQVALAFILLMSNRAGDALHEANVALAQAGGEEVYGAAQSLRLFALMAKDDWPALRDATDDILANGHPCTDRALTAVLDALGLMSWHQGHAADALAHTWAAVRRVDPLALTSPRNYARLHLVNMLTAMGRFEEAQAAIAACRREIDPLADPLWWAAPTLPCTRLHLALGRLEEARTEAEAGLAITQQLAPLFVPALRLCLATIALMRGDLVYAADCLEQAGQDFPEGCESAAAASFNLAQARLLEARAGTRQAHVLVPGICEKLLRSKALLLDEPMASAWLVRACVAVGDNDRGRQVVAWAEELATANPAFPPLAASALHARGLLEGDPALVKQAAEGHVHFWARASATADAGALFVLSGDPNSAQKEFEHAMLVYQQSGAEREAARVVAQLRALGIRHSPRRRAHDDPVTGWESLTGTERTIAEYVADGLTNIQAAERMFLSRHTVDFHLRSIFRKLDITSRVQLSRLALSHGAVAMPGRATTREG